MQPPSANPSKNWWKDNAAIKGLIVHGLCETPSDSPMITECDTIPSSKTCKEKVWKYYIHNLIGQVISSY